MLQNLCAILDRFQRRCPRSHERLFKVVFVGVPRQALSGDLWVSELVLTYDGNPFYVVSIMEFEDGEVVRETQYFGEAFEPGPSRAQWVEQ